MSNTHEWIELHDGRKVYRKIDVFVPNHFGDAPMIMCDSMEPEYHHGVCRTIDSRKDWQQADKESGSATVSPDEWRRKKENIPKIKRAAERELKRDRHQASVKAMQAARENPSALEEKLKKRALEQEQSAKENKLTPLIEKALK